MEDTTNTLSERDQRLERFKHPYWAYGWPQGPLGTFRDLSKEVVPPGKDGWEHGVVGVRVDADFWCVAVLPYEPYAAMPMADIARDLWPEIDPSEYAIEPDSGSAEQQRRSDVMFVRQMASDHKHDGLNGCVQRDCRIAAIWLQDLINIALRALGEPVIEAPDNQSETTVP